MSGKLKISGNILAAQKLQQLWSEEAPNVAATLSETKSSKSTQSSESPQKNTSDVDPDIEVIKFNFHSSNVKN